MTQRIAHLANFYGPRSGGLRTMMRELAAVRVAAGVEVLHIVPGHVDTEFESDGYRMRQIAAPAIPRTGGYRMITDLRSVRHALAAFQPDVIEVSDRLTLLHAAAPFRRRGIPVAMFVHERIDGVVRANVTALPAIRIADALNRVALRSADHIIATTSFAAQEFQRIGHPPIVIPLAVDTRLFHPARRRLRDNPGDGRPLIIGMCSRLSKEKACDIPIEAVRLAVALGRNVSLEILGTGPLERQLRECAAGLPVRFHGYQSDRVATARFLANVDVLMAPGPIETFGLAALEALSCGTPVIANAASAIPEVIGSGGMSAGSDPAEWVAAAIRVQTAGSALRVAARARAEQYSWKSTAAALEKLYGLRACLEPTGTTQR